MIGVDFSVYVGGDGVWQVRVVSFTENIYNTLGSLNSNSEYDFFNKLNLYFGNANDLFDIDVNPFENLKINCNYYDETTFIYELENCKEFILLSANIQSLSSKFSKLVEFTSLLKSKRYCCRVGFYVKEGIKFRVVENLSIFNADNFN